MITHSRASVNRISHHAPRESLFYSRLCNSPALLCWNSHKFFLLYGLYHLWVVCDQTHGWVPKALKPDRIPSERAFHPKGKPCQICLSLYIRVSGQSCVCTSRRGRANMVDSKLMQNLRGERRGSKAGERNCDWPSPKPMRSYSRP